MSWIDEILHDLSTIQSTPHDLKKFGLIIGGLFLLLCGAAFWNVWWSDELLFAIGLFGIFLVLAGMLFPKQLIVIHRWWMSFAIVLGSVVSRVILFFVFFLIVTVISLAARIVGKKFYREHHDRRQTSYWIQRDHNKPIKYERMS